MMQFDMGFNISFNMDLRLLILSTHLSQGESPPFGRKQKKQY